MYRHINATRLQPDSYKSLRELRWLARRPVLLMTQQAEPALLSLFISEQFDAHTERITYTGSLSHDARWKTDYPEPDGKWVAAKVRWCSAAAKYRLVFMAHFTCGLPIVAFLRGMGAMLPRTWACLQFGPHFSYTRSITWRIIRV